jgi:hypothetical protein
MIEGIPELLEEDLNLIPALSRRPLLHLSRDSHVTVYEVEITGALSEKRLREWASLWMDLDRMDWDLKLFRFDRVGTRVETLLEDHLYVFLAADNGLTPELASGELRDSSGKKRDEGKREEAPCRSASIRSTASRSSATSC